MNDATVKPTNASTAPNSSSFGRPSSIDRAEITIEAINPTIAAAFSVSCWVIKVNRTQGTNAR